MYDKPIILLIGLNEKPSLKSSSKPSAKTTFKSSVSLDLNEIVSLSYLNIDLHVLFTDLKKISESDSGSNSLNKSWIKFEFLFFKTSDSERSISKIPWLSISTKF